MKTGTKVALAVVGIAGVGTGILWLLLARKDELWGGEFLPPSGGVDFPFPATFTVTWVKVSLECESGATTLGIVLAGRTVHQQAIAAGDVVEWEGRIDPPIAATKLTVGLYPVAASIKNVRVQVKYVP